MPWSAYVCRIVDQWYAIGNPYGMHTSRTNRLLDSFLVRGIALGVFQPALQGDKATRRQGDKGTASGNAPSERPFERLRQSVRESNERGIGYIVFLEYSKQCMTLHQLNPISASELKINESNVQLCFVQALSASRRLKSQQKAHLTVFFYSFQRSKIW